jgi:hypothetical protein
MNPDGPPGNGKGGTPPRGCIRHSGTRGSIRRTWLARSLIVVALADSDASTPLSQLPAQIASDAPQRLL